MEEISRTHVFRYSWMLNSLRDVAQNNTVKARRALITSGNYVDKGSDSKEVLDYLTHLHQNYQLISLMYIFDRTCHVILLRLTSGKSYLGTVLVSKSVPVINIIIK